MKGASLLRKTLVVCVSSKFVIQCGDEIAFIVFIICLFTTMKNCPIVFTKVGNTFCQILNKPSQNCQRHFILCQSGEISPNLVTLICMKICAQKARSVEVGSFERTT